MKRITVLLGIFVSLFFVLSVKSNAQVCGSTVWLDEMIENGNISVQLLNTSGQPVSSINPSTNYILRVRATGGTCMVSGSGCASGFAPTAYYVTFALGCTVDGKTIPPDESGRDVGSGNNYTANFSLTTLPPASFGGQVLVLVRLRGSKVGICGPQYSNNLKDFNSLEDL